MTTEAEKDEAASELESAESFLKASLVRNAMIEKADEVDLSFRGLAALCITLLCDMIAAKAPGDLHRQISMATDVANAIVGGVQIKFAHDQAQAQAEEPVQSAPTEDKSSVH